MERDEQIAASIRRVVKLKTDVIGREASNAMFKSSSAGRLQSSAHVLTVEEVCVAGFRALSTAAAVQIAEIEGENAPKHADRLAEVLHEVQAGVVKIFNSRAAPGTSSVASLAAERRRHLQQAMDEALQGTVDDLRLGIAGGVNVRKQKAGVSIDNRGGSGQIIVESAGASQTIGRDQITSSGIDAAALLELLRQIREEVARADIQVAARESIEDAIVSAEREIEAPAPNPGRVRRLLGTVGTTARDLGVNVAASLIAAKLQQMGL